MFRSRWLVILVFGVLVLAAGGNVALLFLLGKPQTVSSATSPDGSWSVAVIARPHVFTGAYDLVVEVHDAAGNTRPGVFVIDLTSDLVAAQKHHAVSFLDNKTARVGERTIDKARYFPE